MSHGDLTIRNISTGDEKVNWKRGSGKLSVTFSCNGHPYTFTMRVMYDWLDESILTDINDMLAKEGIERQIYSCEDNGQGAILFYRDEEWAGKFQVMTGIPLQ